MKIDNRGISHYVVPLLIVVVIAVGGVFTLVASHACTPPLSSSSNARSSSGTSLSSASNARGSSGTSLSSPSVAGACNSKTKSAKQPKPSKPRRPSRQQPAPAAAVAPQAQPGKNGNDQGGGGGSSVTDQQSTGTINVKNPSSSGSSKSDSHKSSGDIIVLTYVDDPAIDKKNGKDHRIGGLKVKVEKSSGQNNCDNRQKSVARTNTTKTTKTKDGKPLLIHGTVHYLGCDTGSYKVTLVTPLPAGYLRKYYEVASPTVRTFTLSKNETEMPWFVIKKKAATTSDTSTTQNQANGDGTGNGGTQSQ